MCIHGISIPTATIYPPVIQHTENFADFGRDDLQIRRGELQRRGGNPSASGFVSRISQFIAHKLVGMWGIHEFETNPMTCTSYVCIYIYMVHVYIHIHIHIHVHVHVHVHVHIYVRTYVRT